jgi:hypothetical protein
MCTLHCDGGNFNNNTKSKKLGEKINYLIKTCTCLKINRNVYEEYTCLGKYWYLGVAKMLSKLFFINCSTRKPSFIFCNYIL